MADSFAPDVFPKVLVNYAPMATVFEVVDGILPASITGDDRKKYIPNLAPNHVNDVPRQMHALVADLIKNGLFDKFRLALFPKANPILREILRGVAKVDDEGTADPAALQNFQNKVEPFLNSKSFFEGMDAARYRVCARWVDNKLTGEKKIVGTGFLIAPDLVLTARHVVAPLLNEVPTGNIIAGNFIETTDEQVPGSHQDLACVFDYWTPVSKFTLTDNLTGMRVVRPAAPKWLEWSSSRHPGDGSTHDFAFPPDVAKCLDCTVIRLSERIGAAATGHGGGKMRGWLRLNGAPPGLTKGNVVAILQHPSQGPQVFDKGDFRAQDNTTTRVWYKTGTAGGSSGAPCFDSEPNLVAFHNAGYPNGYPGATKECNQGIRIDHVINAMPPALKQESQKGLSTDSAFWSVSEDAQKPEPILGRTEFKKWILELFDPRASQRVIIVEEAADVRDVGKSGKSFSTRILKAIARDRRSVVVEFAADKIKNKAPEDFLIELGRRIGLTSFAGMPEAPSAGERQPSRWCSNDLPKWFSHLIEERARAAGNAVEESVADPAAGAATGKELVVRELIWIVIDDIHKHPPEGDIKELLAGMMGITDTQHVLGPGLKALRWLVIGHVPDFVRERSHEYKRDEVSQNKVDVVAWTDCIANAFISAGEEEKFDAKTAKALFTFSKKKLPDVQDPATTLTALSAEVLDALDYIRGTGD